MGSPSRNGKCSVIRRRFCSWLRRFATCCMPGGEMAMVRKKPSCSRQPLAVSSGSDLLADVQKFTLRYGGAPCASGRLRGLPLEAVSVACSSCRRAAVVVAVAVAEVVESELLKRSRVICFQRTPPVDGGASEPAVWLEYDGPAFCVRQPFVLCPRAALCHGSLPMVTREGMLFLWAWVFRLVLKL